jgi:hypothetical protein
VAPVSDHLKDFLFFVNLTLFFFAFMNDECAFVTLIKHYLFTSMTAHTNYTNRSACSLHRGVINRLLLIVVVNLPNAMTSKT